MAIQKINLGTEPLGEGGDTYRSANTKINENFSNTAHAASRMVGPQAGNVLEVGEAGLAWETKELGNIGASSQAENPKINSGFYSGNDLIGNFVSLKAPYGTLLIGGSSYTGSPPQYAYYNSAGSSYKTLTKESVHTFWTTQNATKDSKTNLLLGSGSTIPQNSAASRLVGEDAGNLMEVGAFGIGGNAKSIGNASNLAEYHTSLGGGAFFSNILNFKLDPSGDSATLPQYSNYLVSNLNGGGFFCIGSEVTANNVFAIRGSASDSTRIPLVMMRLYHDKNTTKDVATGFLKASSPVLHVYNDKITKIHEAEQLDIKVDKKGIGHYEIHGTTGLRKNDGWNMSPPRDLHGNVLCMIDVTEKDDVVILKTYKKKFDFETVSIVHDYDNPMDIPEGSCVEFRFNDVPKDVTDKSTSETESK